MSKTEHWIFRYMSEEEYEKLMKGETVYNNTDYHKLRGVASTCKGFGFGIGDIREAVTSFRRLAGIVVGEWLLVGISKQPMKKCRRIYRDYSNEGNDLLMTWPKKFFAEQCTTEYSLKDFCYYRFFHCEGYDIGHQLYLNKVPVDRFFNPRAILRSANFLAQSELAKLKMQYMF